MNSTVEPVALRDFVRAITRAATPVTVVTSEYAGRPLGQTVSALSRVSDDPPVLSASIRKRSPINEIIRSRGAFNVSVLGPEHRTIADCFAGRVHSGRPPFTFAEAEWERGRNNVPVLAGAVASLECVLHDSTEIGSHVLYLGLVQRASHTDKEPLLHLRGNYRHLSAPDMEGHRR
ncbi:flavin reductase family protein [Nocardia sp. BMG51109]|uniref:flavin reductase family protein n=1 Tax=Nocardia sp. BMG51109 TaxID=1056816 RepID=UPI00046775B1|nr:flavin reductase family protein [Nocardia sp. BMG51109]